MTPGRCAIVVACPRSGTTWLRRALNEHPQIACVERRLFGRHRSVIHDAGAAQPRIRQTLDDFADAYAALLHGGDLPTTPQALRDTLLAELARAADDAVRSATGRALIIDKVTPYGGTAEIVTAGIRRHYPDAPIVYLVRDGRDVATSGLFHWLTKRAAGDEPNAVRDARRGFFLERRPGARLPRFFSDEELAEWCQMWTTADAVAQALGASHRVLTIRYEEMIRDLAAVLTGLFAFLELPTSAEVVGGCLAVSAFERMSGGRARGVEAPAEHVRKGVVGDWRGYFTRPDGAAFVALAGEPLRRLGYEADDRWLEELPRELSLRCEAAAACGA